MIEFEDVGFSFGGKPVLHRTTLILAPGSFYLLVGASGAGKTTLIRLAWGDLEPTEGRVRFLGKPISRRDRNAIATLRRAIGVVPQDCRFLGHLPILDNVALPLKISGVAAEARAGDLRALLEWVDLADRAGALPSELSRAERRRAALARAVILSPEVILADEPTAGLDREAAQQMLGLYVELNRMGKTVLVATHDPEFAQAAWGRVPAEELWLVGGRVEAAERAT